MLKLLKITAITGMMILLGILVQGYSSQMRLFDNINIKIKGNQFVGMQRIQDELTPYLTQSLLSLNLKEIQDGISTIDFIETNQISRILPNTLVIQILERKPILLITIEGDYFFMDKNGILLYANGPSINFFPVPIITISEKIEHVDELPDEVSELFQFLLDEYPLFYDNLSEVKIEEGKWIFYCDSNTKIFAKSEKLLTQINILKNFEKTVYPNRCLNDYSYIDLRVAKQIIVKEKYRKG